MSVAQSVALFLTTGVCEIGGGYLVWQWWRDGGHWGPPEEEQCLVCSSSSGFPSYISGAVTGRTNL